ncbi:MAG TPA: DUF1643 domain-containing protein [bacterium]|nr:DUF1643 domain-containing protein [bacterium]
MPDLFGTEQYGRVDRSAEVSECGRYRWWLRRSYQRGGDGRVACFVMLNPSTADGTEDDPTIRRCLGFVRAWGYSVLSVRNLFAYRATDPKELLTADNPTGGARGNVELLAAMSADLVVAAWGAGGNLFGRDKEVLGFLRGKPLHCLGLTKGGHPRHPLYVRGDQQPVLFREG